MQQIQPTATINIDDSTFEVSKMSKEVQQMIAYYDDWRQKELDLTSELLMARSGIQQLQTQLLEKIQAEKTEALKKAEALGILPQSTESPVPANDEPTQ